MPEHGPGRRPVPLPGWSGSHRRPARVAPNLTDSMPEQNILAEQLPNGLTLIMEPMSEVRSAAFSLLVPAGSIYEPTGFNGTASILTDLITRGAGDRNSRELSSALDNLGIQRSESVGWNFITFSAASVAENVIPGLKIYADIIRDPLLPQEQFPAAMSSAEQSLLAIEDDPQRKVLVELRRRCYDAPWNRPVDGTLSELEAVTPANARSHYKTNFRPNGTILGVAGHIDPDRVREAVQELFGDWSTAPAPEVTRVPRKAAETHLAADSAQTHIGLAFDAVPYRHEDYYAAWAAVSILSGGSSSRLFTEVREKRGLCYSVYASLNSLLEEARILAYAGTTVERAQETLDVMLAEIRKLKDGIDDSELFRCKARAKSALIMQQESTAARASAIARDWFHLGRVQTLDEIHGKLDRLTVTDILDYVRSHPVDDITLLAVGPEPLQLPD